MLVLAATNNKTRPRLPSGNTLLSLAQAWNYKVKTEYRRKVVGSPSALRCPAQKLRYLAMRFSAIVLTLSVVLATPSLAASGPGDPRLIQGTLEWPAALSGGESFIVLRGDDGRVYYADVAAAQRRVQGALSAGSQIAILGLEGTRPYEVLAVALGSGDAAALSLALAQATPTAPPTPPAPASTPTPSPQPPTPSSQPSTPPTAVVPPPPAASAPVPPARPEEGPTRGSEGRAVTLRGSVYGVAGQNLFVRRDDGSLVVVDISRLGASTVQQLRPGSPVAVVAIPVGNKYLATGFTETQMGPSGSTPAKPAR